MSDETTAGGDLGTTFLASVRRETAMYRRLAERALAQVDEAQFFAAEGGETNSLAVVAKHLGGNLRSRWRDFLTTDGEKPDRDRDSEFVIAAGTRREEVMALWEEGWGHLEATLAALAPEDLARQVTIRGEPHGVVDAIHRQLAHTAYHVGQIVMLARHHAGEAWQTLSVPRGGSVEFNRKMAEKYGRAADSAPG
jgi:hypothetical protein